MTADKLILGFGKRVPVTNQIKYSATVWYGRALMERERSATNHPARHGRAEEGGGEGRAEWRGGVERRGGGGEMAHAPNQQRGVVLPAQIAMVLLGTRTTFRSPDPCDSLLCVVIVNLKKQTQNIQWHETTCKKAIVHEAHDEHADGCILTSHLIVEREPLYYAYDEAEGEPPQNRVIAELRGAVGKLGNFAPINAKMPKFSRSRQKRLRISSKYLQNTLMPNRH